MVDVGAKKITRRRAKTRAIVLMKPATLKAITRHKIAKGNVLESARLAGIMAAKATHQLIPLCHPVKITNIKIEFKICPPRTIEIYTTVEARDRTGVEMEALTATVIAGLTIYDMCKAIDRGITLTDVKLLEKSGGRSGYYKRVK